MARMSEEETSRIKEQFGYFMTGRSTEDSMFLGGHEMDMHTDNHADTHTDSHQDSEVQ
jgi:hypothetical protein